MSETPRLIEARHGFSVFYRGKFLVSRVDPLRQAERAARAALPFAARTLYLLPSPLLGYGIPLIIEALPSDSALLCLEADAALARLSLKYIRPLQDPADGRLQFAQTGNPGAVSEFVNRVWGRRRFRRVEILRLTGGWQLNAEFYEAAADLLRSNLATDWYNAITLSKLGRLYFKNATRNLPLLARDNKLENINFGGRPALVFGAGPSFDSFFDEAGRDALPDSCVKICVDTALKPLFERNIKPDMVVALDAQHWNLRDFCGTGGWRIPVAMALSAPPALSGVLGGPEGKWLFWTRWTELAVFERLSSLGLMPLELPPLGSVGLSAVRLALKLGAGLVFTVGIDLAFTMDKYHCRGSPSHGELLFKHNRFGGLYPLAAFREASAPASAGAAPGGPVWLDDPVMRRFRSLFAAEFAKEGRVFTVGGSVLPGIKTLSVNEALEKISAARYSGAAPNLNAAGGVDPAKATLLREFVKTEEAALNELIAVLKGEIKVTAARLDSLLDDASYLWAHFPDCAGAGGARPPSTDIAFLKRVRAEQARLHPIPGRHACTLYPLRGSIPGAGSGFCALESANNAN